MDFLDPKKRKLHRIQLFIGYGLMAIMLVIGTLIFMYWVNGFSYNPRTGEVTQNGFVFVDAHPEPATIILNGEDKGLTDQRLDIVAGKYSLELRRTGYRSWKRDFTLEGKTIERFVYPTLFPEQLSPEDAQLYATPPAFITSSPDRHWAVIQQPGSFTTFDLVDLSTDVATITPLALPEGLLTAGANHRIEFIEWSTDNRHVVMKHLYDGGQEFFVLDIEAPASSVNLNRSFPVPFTNLSLRDKKFDLYYLHNQADGSVLAADLRDGSTTPVLSNVISFKSHGNDVLVYMTAAGASEGKVWAKIREGTSDYNLRELPVGQSYVVDVARFDNAWYYAAGSDTEQKTYVFKNPVTAIKSLPDRRPVPVGILRLDAPAQKISFSTNARFVAVQAGSQFSVYDAETDRQYRYNTGIELTPDYKANWMDGHRLTVVSQDKIVIFDYDGINMQTLSPAYDGSMPVFDGDYQAMFTLAPSTSVEGRTALTRTSLIVEP